MFEQLKLFFGNNCVDGRRRAVVSPWINGLLTVCEFNNKLEFIQRRVQVIPSLERFKCLRAPAPDACNIPCVNSKATTYLEHDKMEKGEFLSLVRNSEGS